jgi:hypothetical protein
MIRDESSNKSSTIRYKDKALYTSISIYDILKTNFLTGINQV